MGVGIVGWTTTEPFKAKSMKYIFLLILCLIIPIIWGFPQPQFGDYGDEVVNETEDENPNNGDPIGDIFKDIIDGFGLLMQDGINLITNVTQNNALSGAGDQGKVVAAFAKTYSEMAIENLLGFANIFNKRLKCNTKCEGMEEGTEERTQCEKENCIEIEVPRDPKDLEDEYDYSYGYDYSEDDKDNEIGQDGIAPRNDS